MCVLSNNNNSSSSSDYNNDNYNRNTNSSSSSGGGNNLKAQAYLHQGIDDAPIEPACPGPLVMCSSSSSGNGQEELHL
ncbi:unnamed protein product [Lampetra planeri]